MIETPHRPRSGRPYVVVIGSGFGGLFVARKLQDVEVDVTPINCTNHHLSQSLLYQVATGIPSPDEIALSTRTVLDGIQNVRVIKDDITDIDVEEQVVVSELGHQTSKQEYDHLLVAAGAGQSYPGSDHFAEFVPGVKNIDNIFGIRARIAGAFERTELTDDSTGRERLLTFVVAGAGPTGIKLTGQLTELANRIFASSYRSYDPHAARVVLLDGTPQVLLPFGKRLGRKAQEPLEEVGVIVKLGVMVTDANEEGVTYKNMKDGTEEFIPSFCKVWPTGMSASLLGEIITEQTGAETDRAGHVAVNEGITVGNCRNVYVMGDVSSRKNLPGIAQIAIQGGEYVVEDIATEADGHGTAERQPFGYLDKDFMATVSRLSVVTKMGKVEATSFIGWVLWLAIRLTFLVGFRNRFVSYVSWGLSALDRSRWRVVSTRQQIYTRNAIDRLAEFNKDEAEQDLLLEVRDTRHKHRANKDR